MRVLLAFCLLSGVILAQTFSDTEKAWRQEREASLKSESGWLNLAGLFWLDEGTVSFGSGPDVDITLPPFASVEKAGFFEVQGDCVHYEMARAQPGYLNGKLMPQGVLTLGAGDHAEPDVLAYHNLRMFLIKRDGQLGLRVRDLKSQRITAFKGLSYFPPRPKYKVKATLHFFDEPKKVFLATVIGTETTGMSPGILKFTIKGVECQLLPLSLGTKDQRLFILFTDQTTGMSTYSAGRFLYADKLEEGVYELNFNRAINPPCAFTPYATCPMPPDENALDVAVKAGEKIYLAGSSYKKSG
ncbi:MAG: hypothetical protein CSA81_01680 [Acidobacteria bacterium]|nr:MAG: hypothetical protein CSA81_01680 [Acidobacteriota bacterium]